jgi:hypothetical protein
VRGIRDAQARAGITPTDHSRHNILAIKEQSRLNALQKQQQEQQGQQQLRPQMRRTTSGTAAAGTGPGGICRSLSGGGGRAAAAAGGRPSIVRSVSGSGAAGGRGAVGGDGSSDGRDFVQENKAAAAAASRPVKTESRSDGGAAYLQKSEYGQVPAYLLQRKMELAQQEEAMQAAKHAARIPAGAKRSQLCCAVSHTCTCALTRTMACTAPVPTTCCAGSRRTCLLHGTPYHVHAHVQMRLSLLAA